MNIVEHRTPLECTQDHCKFNCDVVVDGVLTAGDIDVISTIQMMDNKISDLEEKLSDMQELVQALWHAPGAPGYQQSCTSWESSLKS